MSKAVKILWRVFFIGFGLIVLMILLVSWGVFGSLPSLAELENPSILSSSEVYAADGTLMGKYYLKDRSNVAYRDISKNAVNALIATEDKRFFEHSGLDARRLASAMVKLGSDGGASTITQQLAKNLLGQGSTNRMVRMIEKLKEMIVALELERNFTKEEIIALYLNTVSYGDEIYGIRNAAKTYFQKEPDRLSVEESAVLIGLLKGNTLYNPRRNPKAALDRRNTVINLMVVNNFLPPSEGQQLKLKPIQLNYKKMDENGGWAPYFRDKLRDDVKKWCKENKNPKTGKPYDIYKDGLKIYTTINPIMQYYAELAVARHMQNMQKVFSNQPNIKNGTVWKGHDDILEKAMKESDRWRNMKEDGVADKDIKKSFYEKVPMKVFAWNTKREKDTIMTPFDSIKYHKILMQCAFMAMDPLTGEVKAWVGGIDFKRFKFDHANIETKRQVGSTFKPILYTLAVMNGFKPETELPEGPIMMGNKAVAGKGGPMAICLAYSRNPGAAYLINQLGVQSTIDFAKKCGIESKIPPYPSIALGSADISLYEMMRAYTMFPGGGYNTTPIYISRIEDRNGNVLAQFTPKREEVISEADAYIMTKMMQGVVDFGTGRAMRGVYNVQSEIAGKTGTTNDNTDGWFIGFSPQLLAGVWVGCDDPFLKLLNTRGGADMAMPAWAYFFQEIYKEKSLGVDAGAKFVKPQSLQNEAIMDYENLSNGELPPPAEGENVGNGAKDYIDVPVDDGSQKVAPESQLNPDEEKVLKEASKNDGNSKKMGEPVEKQEKKKGLFKRIFGKKE